MKKYKIYLTLIALVFSVLLFAGCSDNNQSGGTFSEPDITVDYLQGEYADQLLRDGAEHIFGNIKIETMEDGTFMIHITAKELVKEESLPNGYYIADRNINYSYPLALEARTTFISDSLNVANVLTAEEFVDSHIEEIEKHINDDTNYEETKFYNIYVMNGQIELILAQYLQ